MKEKYLVVDQDGRLVIPPEAARRFGLRPGAEVYFEEGRDALLLHRPAGNLARIYLEPTNACNLNCRTCVRNAWAEAGGFMEPEVFQRVREAVETLSPRPTVFFGGFGEPLLHPDVLAMIRAVKDLGAETELITNATLLDEKRIMGLFQSGLDFLWVSLDGANPDCYAGMRADGAFPSVADNLRRLSQLKYWHGQGRPGLGISFVASRKNLSELPAVLSLGRLVGATRFMVTNVLPHTPEMKDQILYGRAMWNWKSYFNEILLPRMDASPEVLRAFGEVIRIYEWHDFRSHDFLRSFDACPFIEKGSLSVRWDGRVAPCLPLLHGHQSFLDQRPRRVRECPMGSLTENGLLDIWFDHDYMALRKKVREFNFSPCTSCNSCEMAEANQEDCFGNAFPACGGCLWAQGFIQCP